MDKLRLIVSNSKDSNLLAPNYFNYYKSSGINVEEFCHGDQLDNWYRKGLYNKLVFRIYPKVIYNSINKNLIQLCDSFKPSVVWIFKGWEIYPETLMVLKDRGIKLVNYNLDHPFKFASWASGNDYILNSVPIYDLHFSYSQKIISELQEVYGPVNTSFLPFGFPKVNLKILENITEIKRACFIGYGDKERAVFLEELANCNIPIDVYGTNWDTLLKNNKNIRVFPPVYGDNYWQTIRKYRLQLNIFRAHNQMSHNMRSFEVPSVGGILLTPKTPEHLSFFDEGKEMFFYEENNIQQTSSVINTVLAMDETHVNTIRQNAIKRSNDSGYSYENRAQQALNVINKTLLA
jgi:spore maturation protein CgeB